MTGVITINQFPLNKCINPEALDNAKIELLAELAKTSCSSKDIMTYGEMGYFKSNAEAVVNKTFPCLPYLKFIYVETVDGCPEGFKVKSEFTAGDTTFSECAGYIKIERTSLLAQGEHPMSVTGLCMQDSVEVSV